MKKHPLTIEKDHLKSIAADIVDLKERIRGPHIKEFKQHLGRLQQQLAATKRVYRHRFAAYCLVRQSLGKKRGPIMASGTKVNTRLVNIHRVRLLSEIARAQSEHIDQLGEDLNDIKKYEPCIATFKSEKTGRMSNLHIQDFTQKDDGSFVWNCNQVGTVFNKLMDWPVRPGDAVYLEKDEYDNLPPEMKLRPETPVSVEVGNRTENSPVVSFEQAMTDFFGKSEQGTTQNLFTSDWHFAEPFEPYLSVIACYKMVYDVLKTLTDHFEGLTMKQCWTSLPTVPNQVMKTKSSMPSGTYDVYDICDYTFDTSVEAEYVRDWVKTRIDDIEMEQEQEVCPDLKTFRDKLHNMIDPHTDLSFNIQI